MAETSERRYRKRVTIELFPADEAFMRQVHVRAATEGVTLRQWMMAALHEKYDAKPRPAGRPSSRWGVRADG